MLTWLFVAHNVPLIALLQDPQALKQFLNSTLLLDDIAINTVLNSSVFQLVSIKL